MFSDELNKAKESVDSEDFLSITIPSYSFKLGVINFTTQERNFVNVRDAYEPYRSYVRGFLLLIVYGLAAVYLVKYYVNYGRAQTTHHVDSKADFKK